VKTEDRIVRGADFFEIELRKTAKNIHTPGRYINASHLYIILNRDIKGILEGEKKISLKILNNFQKVNFRVLFPKKTKIISYTTFKIAVYTRRFFTQKPEPISKNPIP